MLSRLKNFVYHHKKKFLVSGIVITGAIIATKYSQRKLIEWQEQEAKGLLEWTRKEQHFRSTEKTCSQTVCSLAEILRETLMKISGNDDLLTKLRSGDGNKIHLWDKLKIQVFAQLSTLLYTGLMLVIVLRIQLSVIGGYIFRERIDTQAQAQDIFSSTFQEHFLSLCHYLLNKGTKDIYSLMLTHTNFVLENISLKQKMSLQDIEHIFWAIHASLSNDPHDPLKNLSRYLLPPVLSSTKYKGVDNEKFKQIVDETLEILNSEEVKSIADSSIKRAYSNVVDNIASSYSLPPLNLNTSHFGASIDHDEEAFRNITKVKKPLAKIIPLIHGLYRESYKDDEMGTSWVHQFLIMDNINLMAVNLYEAFSSVP